MSFETPITIKETIENITRGEYFLPAIQREFVWKTRQIEKLFDSLMRDYPISSFLFWKVEKENLNKYQFYNFISNYHERDSRHNEKANFNGASRGITAILDGQQRLTSLYIGLKGSYAYKSPRLRLDNPIAFPRRTLCLNLLSPSKDDDLKYDFKFLTEEERNKVDDLHFWYEIGGILNINNMAGINNYLIENGLIKNYTDQQATFANNTIFQLWQIVHINKSINYFLEKDESLEKVLNVFIRVNSGGTQLNYSDLLLSIASAQWDERDAREEINSFVDQINRIGRGFNTNKDFVLKSCLVLGRFREIAFKVDNFTKENMLKIEAEWENISNAIRAALILVSSFGYSRETLTSNNALIPIALYLHKIGNPSNFHQSTNYADDRRKIAHWLAIVLLKGTFSGQPDNVLRPIREIIIDSTNGFPFDAIVDKLKSTQKNLSFNEDEIDNLFDYSYGQARLFPILAFLYPTLDFNNIFHQDHIFPKSHFTVRRLTGKGITNEEIGFYIDNYNCLANIQMLEGMDNKEKSDKDFKTWLEEKYPNKNERKIYMDRHYIPDVDFDIKNFKEFLEQRKLLIRNALLKLISQK
jgi:uncharacterized protein with ParB-like and HNH nuclease domain